MCFHALLYVVGVPLCGGAQQDMRDQSSTAPKPRLPVPSAVGLQRWVSDIILHLFSLCCLLLTFLRLSTDTWHRLKLWVQTVLHQGLPLTGSLFSIDFKFKQCSQAEQYTSTNTADLTERSWERRDTHYTLGMHSPTWKGSEGDKGQGICRPSETWGYLLDFRSTLLDPQQRPHPSDA